MRESYFYRGTPFHRYPESSRPSDRRYFKGVYEGRKAYLHRVIWSEHFGEIPEGAHIHHKDEDWDNNDPSNLECLTPFEHARLHNLGRIMPPVTEEQRRRKSEAQKNSKFWNSEAGKAVRRRAGAATQATKAILERDCEVCGERYTTTGARSRFCSNNCKSQWRRDSGVDEEDRVCPECGKVFKINKYRVTRHCTRECGLAAGQRKRDVAWYEKVCEICGIEYRAKGAKSRVCSPSCRHQRWKRVRNGSL